ncbi:MAG: hypothetical protein NTU67_01235 [Gemmatimonadetes bacterium]|nr:hypothetical protein [Gemmatimonadota bacterium]
MLDFRRLTLATAVAAVAALSACSGGSNSGTPTTPGTSTTTPPVNPTWNIATQGIPKFITYNYIDLTQLKPNGTPLISSISMFRSGVGHSYGDRDEPCMSKKHYFGYPDSLTKIYVPLTGTVAHQDFGPSAPYITDRIEISPDSFPAFYITIFHAVLSRVWKVGEKVTAGQLLGHHVGNFTMSDISVAVEDGGANPATTYLVPAKQLVSYFDVMTDSVFRQFQSRGITSRAGMQITAAARAAAPITCFLGTDQFDFTKPWYPDKLAGMIPF